MASHTETAWATCSKIPIHGAGPESEPSGADADPPDLEDLDNPAVPSIHGFPPDGGPADHPPHEDFLADLEEPVAAAGHAPPLDLADVAPHVPPPPEGAGAAPDDLADVADVPHVIMPLPVAPGCCWMKSRSVSVASIDMASASPRSTSALRRLSLAPDINGSPQSATAAAARGRIVMVALMTEWKEE